MNAWKSSPGHNANILGAYSRVGCGYYYSSTAKVKPTWGQIFGTGSLTQPTPGK